ncbi:MAG: lipocalin-like domain-containing protein [Anaerolineae bacterium]
MGNLRWVLIGVAVIGITVAGFSLLDFQGGGVAGATVELLPISAETDGFARAIAPYAWEFPRDHGAHPAFQTEWWYYTGNLAADDGARFGFQFTIFRRALSPQTPGSGSEWRSNQAYMAHFTLTDVSGGQFYQAQRFSRGGAGLAGAEVTPLFRVWLDDWAVQAEDAAATVARIRAASDGVAIDLQLAQIKPPALQGEEGLSPKSAEPGNASYYYSLSRLVTEGTITVNGQVYTVSGTTWMDHEFSTSALGPDAQGWDWFGLHLDDDRELMLGRIRLVGGGYEPVFGGLLVLPDGSTRRLSAEDFTLEVLDTWTSPHTGATYPARWRFTVLPRTSEAFTFTLTPLLADQELHEGIAYWEGAVQIAGDVTGYGYAELTGYAGTMNGRF